MSDKHRLTLDQPTMYEIKVPGQLDESWTNWASDLAIIVEYEGDQSPITSVIGQFDQAALQGLLRRLYSLGLPLISVNCVE